jgi:hypothetical protein
MERIKNKKEDGQSRILDIDKYAFLPQIFSFQEANPV